MNILRQAPYSVFQGLQPLAGQKTPIADLKMHSTGPYLLKCQIRVAQTKNFGQSCLKVDNASRIYAANESLKILNIFGRSSPYHGLVPLAASSYFLSNTDVSFLNIFDINGSLGAVNVATILAILNPAENMQHRPVERFVWGLSLSHIFIF